MKKLTLSILFLTLIQFSCIRPHEHYTAELTTSPEKIESGRPVELTFQIKDPNGEKVSDLEIVHEKPMHLFLVSEDLSQYFHEHPVKSSDGTYKLLFTFPNGGKFKIFIDFKPFDDEQTTESFNADVAGEKLNEVELIPEENFEKTVEGLRVQMKPNEELFKHKDLILNFQVFDEKTGEPADDLQNYLGEKAHFVVIRKGLGRFVHAHPISMKNMPDMDHSKMDMAAVNDPSKVSAMVNFPNSGIYKIFAQFKRNDQVITIPFVFEVKG